MERDEISAKDGMRLPRDLRPAPIGMSVVAASFASNLFALAVPIALLQVYDRVIPNAGTATLTTLALGLLVLGLADYAVRIARGRLVGPAAARFEMAAQERVLDRLLQPGADPFWMASGAALLDRFAAIERIRQRRAGEAGLAILDLPFILVFLAVLAVISPVIAAAVLAITALAATAVWLQWRRIARLGRAREARDQRRHAFLFESLAGIEEIRALGAEAPMTRRYERLMGGSVPLTADLTTAVTFGQGLIGAVALVAPVLIAALGAWLVVGGGMSVGGLAAAILLTGRVVQPTLRLEALLVGEQDVAAAEEDLSELLAAPRLAQESGTPVARIETIELRDVGLDRPEGGAPVFEGLSLRLDRGDCISIEGGDGSGRSALLAILAGHLRPDRGSVRINGRDAALLDPAALARRIATLSPEHGMLPGTLLENLTRFEPGQHAEEADALARALGISPALAAHHQGLSAQMDAQGAHGLPRAAHDGVVLISGLVGRPDVILFDEANSNLDARIDGALLRILRRRLPEAITVLVTYRPSFRALARRRFEIADGRLIEIADGPADGPAADPADGPTDGPAAGPADGPTDRARAS